MTLAAKTITIDDIHDNVVDSDSPLGFHEIAQAKSKTNGLRKTIEAAVGETRFRVFLYDKIDGTLTELCFDGSELQNAVNIYNSL